MRKILVRAALLGALVVAANPTIAEARHTRARADLPEATTNDNTKSAGTLRRGVLTVSLYAT